jgi:CRISPR-associated endonuclease Cas1
MAAAVPASRIERRRDWTLPATPQRKDGEIVVADGYGLQIRINRGHLVINDGIPGEGRRERHYGRVTSKLARLVVLGGSGSLSLDALRWLQDVGASLVCVDRDHSLMVTSAATRADAKLRRAQAVAPFDPSGLEIARALLGAKLEGQQQLLARLDAHPHPQRTLERSRALLDAASSIDDAVLAEAEAAAAYWGAWANVKVRFQPADQGRVPDEWRRFGTRTSPLGGGPRMAVNPAGAILNYLYALLEAEARLACLTLGLDPALAIVHADIRGRDSLPLDLMEAVRPSVDRYLLALLRDRVFRAGDFHETQRGNVRLLAPLTHELAETLPAWRRMVAPVAEQVASMLLRGEPRLERLPTPLTESNRRADRARRHGAQRVSTAPPAPRPEPRCKRCGGHVPHRDRVYCDDCLPHFRREQYSAYAKAGVSGLAALRGAGVDPSHGGDAGKRRGATQSGQQRERRKWESANPVAPSDPEWFRQEILPRIQGVALSELADGTGLSLVYVSQVRRGLRVPHRRHWSALLAVSESS